MEVTLPYLFTPRSYQRPLLKALDNGCKRAVAVWHRRSGKDKVILNFVIKQMWERVGAYYYFFPEYAQGRKVIWEGIDRDGFKFLDHFPKELIEGSPNNVEMKIKLINGSLFQIVGTDNFNSILGTNPIGCVFSEYSLQNPTAWDFIRPILRENGGWAVFCYTPRGMNHGWDILETAKKNNWFWEVLTARETQSVTKEQIEEDRKEGMPEPMIQQEYYCDFQAALVGAYFGAEIGRMRAEGRITKIPYESGYPVHTFWDLGIGDATSIGFYQFIGKERRMIDYYESSGEGLPHYARILQERGYVYGSHNAPHDIEVRELGSGVSRLETARKLGINFRVVKNIAFDDGINAARLAFNNLWVDGEKCAFFLKAIAEYQKEWDDKRKCFKDHPRHDWTSHCADQFRYMAVGSADPAKLMRNTNFEKRETPAAQRYRIIPANNPVAY